MSDRSQRLGNSSFFMLFQVAFGLPIAFWTSLEGSMIEMKSATFAPQYTILAGHTLHVNEEGSGDTCSSIVALWNAKIELVTRKICNYASAVQPRAQKQLAGHVC